MCGVIHVYVGMNMTHLRKRPSIAPVPAMLDSSTVDITVESESDSEPELEEDEHNSHAHMKEWVWMMN